MVCISQTLENIRSRINVWEGIDYMGRYAKVRQYNHETRYKVYDFLVDFFIKNGYAPSVREICRGVGLKSTSSVYSHLLALEDEGKIEIKGNMTRAIKLIGYKFVKEMED